LITTAKNGLYRPEQTFLHRLDPRLKVLSSLLLVILAFAATGWAQLFALIASVSVAFWLIPSLTGSAWRFCWTLRWLLLFTLLMHVLFSSGRTLWGFSSLSLDGLLMGSFVCLQILLAVILSALLAMTTSTTCLASTFGWFVQPLQWLGCRTEEWQKLLLLTMDFIPIVQQEICVTTASDGEIPAEGSQPIQKNRWAVWTQKLLGLLARLVDRGDTVAHRMAANGDVFLLPTRLSPLLPLSLLDRIFLLVSTLMVIIYCLAG